MRALNISDILTNTMYNKIKHKLSTSIKHNIWYHISDSIWKQVSIDSWLSQESWLIEFTPPVYGYETASVFPSRRLGYSYEH